VSLGDGTTSTRASPVPVSGGLTFAKVSVGDNHTCDVTTSNVAYCWGNNADGQVGDGTQIDRLIPVRVGP
jgi:alpha-tubulin suppressor-like RCC1 family protein